MQSWDLVTITDLNIVPVESAFPHDQHVSLRVWGAESLLTEGQKGPGAGQEEQRWDSVRHSVRLFVEKHRPGWEVRRPHAPRCVCFHASPLRRTRTSCFRDTPGIWLLISNFILINKDNIQTRNKLVSADIQGWVSYNISDAISDKQFKGYTGRTGLIK